MTAANTKKAAIRSFDPTFGASTVEPFESLFQDAYQTSTNESANTNIFKLIDQDSGLGTQYSFETSVRGKAGWFEFGHPSMGGDNLSLFCPFKLFFEFDHNDQLKLVRLTLFILNARFIFLEGGYSPASIAANFKYSLEGGPRPIGLAISRITSSDGSTDRQKIFEELTAPLPAGALDPLGAPWRAFDRDTLLGGLVVEMAWRAVNGKFPKDSSGKAKNKVLASMLGGTGSNRLSLFAPGLKRAFNGLIHESERFGLNLETKQLGDVEAVLVLGEHNGIKGADATKLKSSLREFGLKSDFRGIIFTNIGAHWLDDSALGVNIVATNTSLAAIAFHEKEASARSAKIYFAFAAELDPTNNESYLKLLKKGAVLNLTLAGSKIRNGSIAATFADTSKGLNPYQWLAGKKAKITLTSMGVNEGGVTREEYGLDISFDADQKSTPLVTYTAADLGLDEKSFTYLTSVLTLAPILKIAGKVTAPENPKEKRVRFIEVGAAEALEAAFGAAALSESWFFKNAIRATEFRVTGARILSQPTVGGQRETAVLFDVETEFGVESTELPLNSSKALAVRVENTGILFSNGKYRWVQVLQGAFRVEILDSSVWDLGGLFKLLKIKQISLKMDAVPSIDLTLGMSLNLGVVTADDFKISFDIASEDLNLGIYPSKIRVDIAGVLKGVGQVSFGRGKDFAKDISGMLDASLASGLRVAAAARVAHFQDETAFAAGAQVILPTSIPLLSTGLGIKGFQALYASHFVRKEPPAKDGVPASLQWLQKADGEVAIASIANKDLWDPKYGRWSYGLGLILVLAANEEILNLNTILVLDVPGPTITIFAKLSILDKVLSNKDQAAEGKLITGMLGMIQLDVPNHTLTAGALVDYKLDFLQIYGALENQYSLQNLTDWHLFIGHYNRPLSAKLKFGSVDVGATSYFMAAGNNLVVPNGPNGVVDLPGLALSLGAAAYFHLGSGPVYLSVEMQSYLNISISKSIYVSGGLQLVGELFLFIASIGISNTLTLEFYKGDKGEFLEVRGKVCGSLKLGFTKLEGCVSVAIGSDAPTNIEIPALVSTASIVSGANVALLGQGATSGIDNSLCTLKIGGAFGDAISVPLDAVIAISMAAAPATKITANDFVPHLRPASPETTFQYGKRSGGYELTKVSLKKQVSGKMIDIPYTDASAVWWRNLQKVGDRQPLALDLALLARTPFAAQNAVPSEETMKRWIAALTGDGGICSVVPPQYTLAGVEASTEGTLDQKTSQYVWDLRSRFKDRETEISLFGAARPPSLSLKVDPRFGYGSANDRFAGYPRHLVRKVVETQAADTFAFLALVNLPRDLEGPPTTIWIECAGFTKVLEGEPQGQGFVELLLASPDPISSHELAFEFQSATSSIAANVVIQQDPHGTRFHDNWENWRGDVEGFLSLSGRPEYGALNYSRIIVEPSGPLDTANLPLRLKLTAKAAFDSERQLFIGAAKFLSVDEVVRAKNQTDYNIGIVAELEAFLHPPQIPVLDPLSKYEVSLTWNTQGSGISRVVQTDTLRFTTAQDPPRRLNTYLLSTFPAEEERLHPFGHQPGFSISSADILRILQKFEGLRLKITVIEDGSNPVVGTDANGATIDWSNGCLYDPSQLMELTSELPSLDREWFDALPSPLVRALKQAIADHKLCCMDNAIRVDQGLWIGLRVRLQPLLGYTVRVELCNKSGNPWPFVEASEEDTFRFLEWHFTTGVHSALEELRDAFSRCVPRNRAISDSAGDADDFNQALADIAVQTEVCDEYKDILLGTAAPPPTLSESVQLVPDQSLEDILCRWTEERSPLNAEADISVLWKVEGTSSTAVAILLRSREPMLRRTQTAKIERSVTDLGSADVLRLASIITRYPSIVTSKGLRSLYVSSSGTCAIGFLIPDLKGAAVVIGTNEYAPHYLPHLGAAGLVDLVTLRVRN